MIYTKVAFYTDTYLPAVDGVVTSIVNFRKGLEERGHKVYIFAAGDITKKDPPRQKDGNVITFAGIKFKPYPQYRIAFFPYHSVLNLRRLNVDIVHAQTPYMMGFSGLVSSKLLNCPVVGSFHTWVMDKRIIERYYPRSASIKNLAKKYVWKYTTFFFKKCNVTIAPSNTTKEMLEKHGIRNVEVVPNGVDLSKFNLKVSKKKAVRHYGLDEEKAKILYIGRLSPEKKVEVAIKAMKYVDNAVLLVGGTGPEEERYKRLVRSLGIEGRVRFLGFVSDEILPSLYSASDLLCHPSTFETQGITAIEAMACGKPVVGADFMALSELIINGYNGEKFKADDYRECSMKIRKVLNNIDSYKFGALETAKKFSIASTTKKLLNVYERLI
ncbi:MAG: glycosyltransferase [Candidatus Micrarchaeaceae archaeon]